MKKGILLGLLSLCLYSAIAQNKKEKEKEKEYEIKLTLEQAKELIFVLNKSNESHAVVMELIGTVYSQINEQDKVKDSTNKGK